MIFSRDSWKRAPTEERERSLLLSLEHGMSVVDMEKILSDAEIVGVLVDEHDMTAKRIAGTLLRIGWSVERAAGALRTRSGDPEVWGALLFAGVSSKELRNIFGEGEDAETPPAGKTFEKNWMEEAEREDAERELRWEEQCFAMAADILEKTLASLAEEGFSESEVAEARAYLERRLELPLRRGGEPDTEK